MPQVLRLDDSDARIQYAPPEAWGAVLNSGEEWNPDGTYHGAKARGAQLFFLFRGGLFHLVVQVLHVAPLTSDRHRDFSSWPRRDGRSISPATTRCEEYGCAPE
jgi:hypothetical protein